MAQNDPTFELIRRHRVAHHEWMTARAASGDEADQRPNDLVSSLERAAIAAAWELLDEPPASPGGLMMLATYAGDFVLAGNTWPEEWEQKFYRVVLNAPLSWTTGAPSSSG